MPTPREIAIQILADTTQLEALKRQLRELGEVGEVAAAHLEHLQQVESQGGAQNLNIGNANAREALLQQIETSRELITLEGQRASAATEAAGQIAAAEAEVASAAEQAAAAAEALFRSVNAGGEALLQEMRAASAQIRAERALLQEAARTFGAYSPPVMNMLATAGQVEGLHALTPTPADRAYLGADTAVGAGTAARLAEQTAATSAYTSVLSQMIATLGIGSQAVANYSEAFGVSNIQLDRFNALQKLATGYTREQTAAMQGELAAFKLQQSAWQEMAQIWQMRNWQAQNTNAVLGPQLPANYRLGPNGYPYNPAQLSPTPLGPAAPSPAQSAAMRLDSVAGAGTAAALSAETAAMQANQAILSQLVATKGAGAQVTRDFAAAIGVSDAALQKMGGAAASSNERFTQFVRGMAAGFFQFTLLATVFVVAGRAVAEFTSGAVEQFRTLEKEAQNLSTVQVGLNTEELEASLQRLRQVVPATLQQISTGFYEIASVGGTPPEVSEKLTRELVTGAQVARADTKTWVDDVVTTMSQYRMAFSSANEVQAKFFQAAKDSIATPAQLAAAWGPVALSVQQAGGSMDDALALMVAASRGVGSFEQNMTTVYRFINELNTTKTREDLEAFGVSVMQVKDGMLQMRPAIEILQQVKDKMAGLSQAQQVAVINELFPEMRATRGAETLLSHLDDIYAEYPKLQSAGAGWAQATQSYMDNTATKVQLAENAYQAFRAELGKKIDPVRLVFAWSQTEVAKGISEFMHSQVGNLRNDSLEQYAKDTVRPTLSSSFGPGLMGAPAAIESGKSFIETGVAAKTAEERIKECETAALSWAASIDDSMQRAAVASHAFRGAIREDATTIQDAMRAVDQEMVNTAATTFKMSLTAQIGQGFVKEAFGKLPSDISSIFAKAAALANVTINSEWSSVVNTMAIYAAQIQLLYTKILDPTTNAVDREALSRQLLAALPNIESYINSHQDILDPAGAESRRKSLESINKQIADLQTSQARTDALAASQERVTAAQRELADVTAHYNAQLQIQRDLLEELRSGLSSYKELQSTIASDVKEAVAKGPALTEYRDVTGPKAVEDWRAEQLDYIEKSRASQVTLAQNSGLPAQEIASQVGAINAAAQTAAAGINGAADSARKMLASLPEGLTQSQTEFENTINWYKGKIQELQTALQAGQRELERRQLATYNSTPSTPEASGLRGPFMPSASDMASKTPSFLNQVPTRLQEVFAGAEPTAEGIARLRHLIEDPVVGSGFLVPFMQQLADAKAALRDMQAAAAEVREGFAARNFEIGTAQYELNSRRTPVQRGFEDERFALSQRQYAARQAEQAVMRPLTDELWQYNLALSDEQYRMTLLQRTYSRELIPLQRELNAVNREATAIQQAQQMQDMQQALQNQANTLTKLTPGTAAYLAVRQGLAKAEADYALKAKAYSLQERISDINEEKDAAVQAEQDKIDALSDEIHTRERASQVIQHNFEVENRGIQDSLDALQNREAVSAYNFGLEQRRIDDRKTALDEEQRRFDYNEGKRESAAQKDIELAGLSQTAAEKAAGAWAGYQSASNLAIQNQISDWQLGLAQWELNYTVWKDTKLKPLQDQVNDILKSGGKAAEEGLTAAIRKISEPGGIISQIQAIAAKEEATKKAAVEYWQDQDKALQLYYSHLQQMAQMAYLLEQKKYAEAAAMPPPTTATPPGPTSTSGEVGTGVGKASGGWVGLHGRERVTVGEAGPEYVLNNTQALTLVAQGYMALGQRLEDHWEGGAIGDPHAGAPMVWEAPNYRGGIDLSSVLSALSTPVAPVQSGGAGGGARAMVVTGNTFVFNGNGPYRSQADADRDGRMLLRSITGYAGMTGTSEGWGSPWDGVN